MSIHFYPKRLLVMAIFIVAFGSVLSLATDLRLGIAVGALAVLGYLLVEVFVFFNPAVWWQERRKRPL